MVRVYSEAYVSRNGWCTDVRDQVVGAKWDGYSGTNVHGGLDARFNGVGAVPRAPAVGADGQSMSDGHYGYDGWSGQAGAIWCS